MIGGYRINWPVVVIRLLDGFLYGTGFVLALVFWFKFLRFIVGAI